MSTTANFLPTAKEAITGAKDLGLVALGMIGAHAVVTVTKKDTPLVNGAIAVAGFGVYVKAKHPLLKMLGLGASAYGSIKLLNNVTKAVATPATTEGLNGILPEKAKEMIRKFIPTLSGMDEVAGTIGSGSEQDFGDLDDPEMRGLEEVRGTEEPTGVEGLGEVSRLAA